MHTPGLGEEDAAVVRHGHVVAEQVLERAATARSRVRRLGDLWELERVAEQQQVPRRPASGERVSEGELTSLINDEDVNGLRREIVAREGPRRAGDKGVRGVRVPGPPFLTACRSSSSPESR
jgi:hypothetical protein